MPYSRVKMVYEVYKIIKDNNLKERQELAHFLMQDLEKYSEHLEFIMMDTIYFDSGSVQAMLDRLGKRLEGANLIPQRKRNERRIAKI